jgi:hypothetical protein
LIADASKETNIKVEPNTFETLGKFCIEKPTEHGEVVMHPTGEHLYTMIWIHGFGCGTEEAIPKFADVDVNFPENVKIVIPKPHKDPNFPVKGI